ncbi:MAG TPA: hypothetical protein VF980_01385 [Thermoanaerobaculia bacterium]
MNGEMPLSENDFSAIRANVMSTIAVREARLAWTTRGAELALAIIVVVTGTYWWTLTREVPFQAVHHIRIVVPTAPVMHPAASVQPRQVAEHHPGSKSKHVSLLAAAARHEDPIRVELTTGDPDIRIIWISNSNEVSKGDTR